MLDSPLDSPGTPGPTVRTLDTADPAAVREVVAALDATERQVGVPLVDEAERQRLDAAVNGDQASNWHAWLAQTPSADASLAEAPVEIIGYAAITCKKSTPATAQVIGDAAPFRRDAYGWRTVLPALVRTVAARVRDISPSGSASADPQLWIRHVGPGELDHVKNEARLERQLAVLGRSLPERVDVPKSDALVRTYVPGVDDAAVVNVLAAAYEGTGDGGWDLAQFKQRRTFDWFAPEDLLLATVGDAASAARDATSAATAAGVEATGGNAEDVVGLMWCKRRSETEGEVYNLAVHPKAQGRGLGSLLLAAGLAHLREVGCTDVILWVDRANARAVEVYESAGFTTRWDDVAVRAQRDAPAG